MRQRGFSILEMAIVLAIAGTLIAVTGPRLQGCIDRNRVAEAVVEIGEMSTKIRQYEVSKAMLPDTLADVNYGGRVDPWNQPYEYVNLRTSPASVKARKDKNLKPLNYDYDLYSIGPGGLTAASPRNGTSPGGILLTRYAGVLVT